MKGVLLLLLLLGLSSAQRFGDGEQNSITDDDPPEDSSQLDYPTYMKIPPTSFSCQGKVNWHYYADIDTGCQTFHICESQRSKISFLCPVGSVFNQRHLVCDWWYNVDCTDSEDLYHLRGEEDGFELSLASSGGNAGPTTTTTAKSVEKRVRKQKA